MLYSIWAALLLQMLALCYMMYPCFRVKSWLCHFKCTEYYKLTVAILSRDEYKEFEKLIQEDLQEVDERYEEEEVSEFMHLLFLYHLWSNLSYGMLSRPVMKPRGVEG